MYGYGYNSETVALTRDTEAIQVPSGFRLTLPAGMNVGITQALGGTYTVLTEEGEMVRIAGKDADALGKEIPPEAITTDYTPRTPEEAEDAVWTQLRTCYDPEIPVNIADLGLVYTCKVTELPEGGYRTDIEMTLTAPGCGMGDVLKAEVESKVAAIPDMKQVEVEMVFDPPWDMSMLPEAARLELGML